MQPSSHPRWKVWLEVANSVASVIQSVATVIAIVVGGVWTYVLFVENRERFPKAAVDHDVSRVQLDGDRALLRLVVRIENSGKGLLRLTEGEVRVQQILPLSECSPGDAARCPKRLVEANQPVPELGQRIAEWPITAYWATPTAQPGNHPQAVLDVELEPGEQEFLSFDFIVSEKVRAVQVYSYFMNPEKQDQGIGWKHITFHELTKEAEH